MLRCAALCCAVLCCGGLGSACMLCGAVLHCTALKGAPEHPGTEGCAPAPLLLSLTSPPFPLACPGASVLPFSLTSLPCSLTFPLSHRYIYDHMDDLGELADASIQDVGFIKGSVISVGTGAC